MLYRHSSGGGCGLRKWRYAKLVEDVYCLCHILRILVYSTHVQPFNKIKDFLYPFLFVLRAYSHYGMWQIKHFEICGVFFHWTIKSKPEYFFLNKLLSYPLKIIVTPSHYGRKCRWCDNAKVNYMALSGMHTYPYFVSISSESKYATICIRSNVLQLDCIPQKKKPKTFYQNIAIKQTLFYTQWTY